MHPIITAAAVAAALWGLKRWMDHRYVQIGPVARNPTETWENEGGALSAGSTAAETARRDSIAS